MPTLIEWIKELDKIFIKTFGMNYDDFEDYDWKAEWEAEISPEESFEEWRYLAGDKQ